MPRRSEQRRGSRGQSNVRVAGGIVALVTLRFDDHPADSIVKQPAADQVVSDVVHRAIEEPDFEPARGDQACAPRDRKSTRLNSSHPSTSYAGFCLKKK